MASETQVPLFWQGVPRQGAHFDIRLISAGPEGDGRGEAKRQVLSHRQVFFFVCFFPRIRTSGIKCFLATEQTTSCESEKAEHDAQKED